jgi:AcrR family transcriptional regulator
MQRRLTGSGGNGRLGPQDWLAMARRMLIAEGVDRVKVERIAARLGVTRGGFYWHFKNRQALLDGLLREWERANTDAFIAAIQAAPPRLEDRILKLFTIWIEAKEFDVGFEIAVRNWARTSKKVNRAVHRADARRLEFIQSLFEAAGYDKGEAPVRARVLYYTQIGYYAIEEHETIRARTAVAHVYYEVYTGRKLSPAGATEFNARFERYRARPPESGEGEAERA